MISSPPKLQHIWWNKSFKTVFSVVFRSLSRNDHLLSKPEQSIMAWPFNTNADAAWQRYTKLHWQDQTQKMFIIYLFFQKITLVTAAIPFTIKQKCVRMIIYAFVYDKFLYLRSKVSYYRNDIIEEIFNCTETISPFLNKYIDDICVRLPNVCYCNAQFFPIGNKY